MNTPNTPPQLDTGEARRILTDPALCVAFPSLRRLAYFAAATARGKPIRQIQLRHRATTGDAA